jgi:predicted nucleotidyltransferase
MDVELVPVVVIEALRAHGARFAFVHGSRARGTATDASDLDVAAWFGGADPAPWVVAADLPARVDLLVLDAAPLELAGRVAQDGMLVLDDDPVARVRWQALTRRVWHDERERRDRTRRLFAAGARARG